MDFGRECLVFVQGKEKTDEVAYLSASSASMNIRYKNKDFMYSYDTNSATVFYLIDKIDLTGGVVVYEYDIPLSDVREVYQFEGFYSIYIGNGRRTYPATTIRFVPNGYGQSKCPNIMEYFKEIAAMAGDQSYENFDYVHPESVLYKYLNIQRSAAGISDGKPVFFPFDHNLCEMEAVKNALSNDISIIDCPQGSLKIETIINLIMNIAVLRNQKLAVVSTSDAAVDDIYKRIKKEGYNILLARLGRDDLNMPFSKYVEMFSQESEARPEEITELNEKLEKGMGLELKEKKLQEQLYLYQLEQKHFKKNQYNKQVKKFKTFPLIKWDQKKTLNLWADIQLHLSRHKKITIWTKIRYFLMYCIYDFEQAMSNVDESIYTLQNSYLAGKTNQLQKELEEVRRELGTRKYQNIREKQKELSGRYAKKILFERYNDNTFNFNNKNYRDKGYFKDFLKRFPVVLDTIGGIKDSIRDNYIYDYMIIDNSSQSDLLSGVKALSCCRRAIIVGDSKQTIKNSAGLSEIISVIVDEPFDYFEQSLMSSFIKLYKDSAPVTFLREQYTNHPDSVRFFGKQFYKGKLVSYSGMKNPDDFYTPRDVERIRNEIFYACTEHLGISDTNEIVSDVDHYIEYLTMNEDVTENQAIPVYDMLYRDYNDVLLPKEKLILKKWKYKSVNKVYAILRDILGQGKYRNLRFNYNMRLPDVLKSESYSAGDEEFIKKSVIDFTIYSKYGKKPGLVIGIDGFAFHKNNPEQLKYDHYKDTLLEKSGVKVLRLPAGHSDIEKYIEQTIEKTFF